MTCTHAATVKLQAVRARPVVRASGAVLAGTRGARRLVAAGGAGFEATTAPQRLAPGQLSDPLASGILSPGLPTSMLPLS